MWTKFCGITLMEDADYAYNLGADAIGLVFTKSPRQVSVAQARFIARSITRIKKVGVFVNESISTVKSIQKQCQLDFVQLHGEEPPEYCAEFGESAIKAFRIKSLTDLDQIESYPKNIKILLDTFVVDQPGGTGKVIDNEILNKIENPENIILAGGLTPQNLESILLIIKPYGLDVSSGIEQSPGVKDHKKMKNFIDITERYK